MSTTFGIHKDGLVIELVDDQLPENINENDFIVVAHRTNGGYLYLENPFVKYLKEDIKVYPLDNTAQGIYTVKDLLDDLSN